MWKRLTADLNVLVTAQLYSSTGKVLEGPAKKNLKSYKTTYDAEANTLTINM